MRLRGAHARAGVTLACVVGIATGAGCARKSGDAGPEAPASDPYGDPSRTLAPDSAGDAVADEAEGADHESVHQQPFAEPPPSPAPVGPAAASSLDAAWEELENAATELAAAGSSCVAACRALGSMERAQSRICALSGPLNDRCERAKERVLRATAEVERSCGRC